MKLRTSLLWMLCILIFLLGNVPAAYAAGEDKAEAPALFEDTLGHWAQKDVHKLALLRILNGQTAKQFNPKANVKQQDVVITAIRLMGLDETAKSYTSSTELPFQVDEYAKPYVLLAVDRHVLDVEQEQAIASGEEHWGRTFAKREWVAKLAVQAIGKQQIAVLLASQSSSFEDRGEISAWAIGYVNAAQELGIVKGSNNRVAPQQPVTRAEMAVMFSSAYNQIQSDSSLSSLGRVIEMNGETIRLKDANGNEQSFLLHSETQFYSFKEKFNIPSSTVEVNDEVLVIPFAGYAQYVEITNDEIPYELVRAKLLFKNAAIQELTVEVDGLPQDVKLASNVMITDSNGMGVSFDQLVPLSILELKLNPLLTGKPAQFIVVKEVPVNKSSKGLLKNSTQNQMTVADYNSGNVETYSVAANVSVTYNNLVLTLRDLHPNDEFNYVVENSTIVSIQVTKLTQQILQGKIKTMDIENGIIVISSGSELVSKEFAPDVMVLIDGLPKAKLSDLTVTDEVQLTLQEDQKVHQIKLMNRKMSQTYYAKMDFYNLALKTAYVTINNKASMLTVNDRTIIDVNGTEWSGSNFSQFISNGQRVDITYSGDVMLRIKLSGAFEGTLHAIDQENQTITIENAEQDLITLLYGQDTQVQTVKSAAGVIADLTVGDYITLTMNDADGEAAVIQSKRSAMYTVKAKDNKAKTLTAVDLAGRERIFTEAEMKLLTQQAGSPTFNLISLGLQFTADYHGSKPVAMEIPKQLKGVVTKISGGTKAAVELKGYDGKLYVLSAVQGVYALNKAVGLDMLQPEDRVNLFYTASGALFVEKLAATERIVSEFVADYDSLVLERNGTDKTIFTMKRDAYVHMGEATIDPTQLYKGTTVRIYLHQDVVVELEVVNK